MMVKLTIDGQQIEVPEGTTVLRAAEMAGISIPTLCDHKELSPYGGCRLCLVEVEGARTLQPSCTLPAGNNMVVRTNTPSIHEARKLVLTLLFSERNHFCPFCQVSGGDCELQNAAYGEGMTHWPLVPNWTPYAMDASNPFFVLDNNRCILCRRCVRACGELVGNYTLGFEERGANSFLVADFGVPLGESTCVSCGTCVQVCPTGALIDRVSAYRGKDVQAEHHKTVCVGCSVGCELDVLTRDNNLVRIEGIWQSEVNEGVLCKVGRFMPTEETRQRILTPLVRENGTLKAATWEKAISVAVSHLKDANTGVAALASTRLPAESLAAFKKLFADKIGARTVTSIEEGRTTAVPAALADELGKSFEGKLADLKSSDCVVLIGANLVDNHQVAGFMVKRVLPYGTKLIVVDPAENPLDGQADVTIKAGKAGDVAVLQALEAALTAAGKSGSALKAADLETLAGKAGVSVATIQTAAKHIAAAHKPVFVYGKGITAQESTAALKALLSAASVAGASVVNTKGEANSLAAAQLHLDKPFKADGASMVFLALGDDEPSQRLIGNLEKAPFTVVAASYASKITANADVVLPVTNWLEQDGTYINLEGLVQQASHALNAPEGIWTSQAVLESLAHHLGIELDSDWKELLQQRIPTVAITAG